MEGTERRVLRVHAKTWEAEGVTSVTLVDPTGADLPAWEPGAHLALQLPGGLVREYSLCSDPADRSRWTVAVLRKPDSRGGSSLIHDGLPVGTLLEVDGPRNAFGLDESASSHVLVAGGIGITPILAMTRRLAERGAQWTLLYTGRSRSSMAFLDEISALPGNRVTVHADDEADGGYPDIAGALAELAPDALVYCCGPESLMTACADVLGDSKQLRIERFKAPDPIAPVGEESAFDVVLASTGQRIPVGPDTSVLAALENAGVPVESSCTEGICGTCEVGVVKGDVDHRDFLLSPDEHATGSTMFPCVSRCRSAELVLDL
ncbi:oxidoreductase [Rhodococcus triatomae]|uniref:Ferredoxin-NADP reductase n=1 Tax=Rhodococcus triatomae TaxID=300028 RepID=A0A1G8BAD3_9NOCA|nr:PDR/VanB family oxidoreductase [Rhodococcus triatomae]QNG17496.1 oxidoreductase [Rhodococcus triatomae]QNG22836.1 oxidoreductase [Rhodococcus triatomae]SDH30177.1 Ferredoxin-NADP reductase [Rhodococcus triatomae]